MLIALLNLFGFIAVISLISGAVAAICRLLTKSNFASKIVGSLFVPAMISAQLIYWLNTMEVDEAAPGNVLIGNLLTIAAATAIGFLASHLTIRFLSRRTLRNDG